jgi:glycosyltransferase involved in cell wall biosynthesis
VSVKGRFHAFDLARELHRLGHLERLITSYPAFEAVQFGVPADRVDALVAHEAIGRIWARLPAGLRAPADSRLFVADRLNDFFDARVASRMPSDTQIFVGWSGLSLRSIRHARSLGAVTIVERGSSHITFQEKILAEEHERWSIRWRPFSRRGVARDLAEYNEADYVAVPSEFVKRTFIAQGFSAGRLIHNPYGVDLNAFRPGSKPDSVFRVIHCGAISLRKGIPYLLEAFRRAAVSNSELWMIGTVSDEVRSILARNLGSSVRVMGPVPQRELPRYYAMGSVLCLASVEDGWGMVQNQAMACGLPVVCTENTGGSDLVRDGIEGYVVPIRDSHALAEKLVYLSGHAQLAKQMGAAARSRVMTGGFTWSDYGRRAASAYRKALEARARQPDKDRIGG